MKKRVFRERYNNVEEPTIEEVKKVVIKDKKKTTKKKTTKKKTTKKKTIKASKEKK